MDGVSGVLVAGFVRTTICTALAALIASVLLPMSGVLPARVHRLAWVLVVLQGWIVLPITLTVSPPPAHHSISTSDAQIAGVGPDAFSEAIEPPIPVAHVWIINWEQALVAIWLVGAISMPVFYFVRFRSMIAQLPLGVAPVDEQWDAEWHDAIREVGSPSNVQLRITRQLGPLLCYIPHLYFVLVPRCLWGGLSKRDRMAILRHELVHLRRHDIWKNLAIRVLALPQWFNPFVWIAVRRFEEAGEWACDEEVVASPLSTNAGYANTLIRAAQFSTQVQFGAVSASGGLLSRRVTRILSSSDKEVSKMKCFAIPFLLLAIAVFQAIRVEPASADVIPEATALKDRAAIVRRWQAGPYRIEPPDVLSVEVKWNNFDGVINAEHEDVLSIVTATGLKVARQEDGAIRLTARQLVLRLESLVRPDGQISIGGLVRVYVTGMTTEEAKEEIAIELSKRFGTPEVKVDVSQANSRVVYVVLQRGQSGDYVARLNHPGHLTALDALTEALANADCDVKEVDQMYVEASPSEQLARIDLDPISLTSDKSDADNVELVPGDRLFVVVRKRTSSGKEVTNRSASHRILPNPGSIPPYQASTIPATTADLQHSQMYAGSIVAIRFDGEAARRLMGPLVTGSAPGLTLDIAGRVAEVASNGHLFVEANTESQSQDGKHYRSISVSGIVKPTDVGPNRQISAEKIASLRVEIRDSPKRSLGESRIDGTEK